MNSKDFLRAVHLRAIRREKRDEFCPARKCVIVRFPEKIEFTVFNFLCLLRSHRMELATGMSSFARPPTTLEGLPLNL